MIMIGTSWKNSIFIRLLLTFVIVLLPLFILGFSIYNWGIKIISNEIISSMQAQTDFYKNDFEKDIQRIKMLQFGMLNDANLNTLAVKHSFDFYDKTIELNSVQQRVESIKSSSRYIHEIKVLIPGIKKTITSTSILDMEVSEDERIKILSSMPDGKINYFNGELFLNVKSPIKGDFDINPPDFCIEIILSESEMRNTLQGLIIYNGSGSFIFSSNLDLFINGTLDKVLPNKIINSIQSEDISKNYNLAADKFELKYVNNILLDNGKKVLISHSPMEQLNLTLVRYVPEDQVLKKVGQFRILFWVFTITAFIIIVIFSFIMYRFIHRPLSKMTKAFDRVDGGDMAFEIRHNHNDEFKNIYERFNNMVVNLNKLIEQVYKQKIHSQKAELKHLQSQINPHFLYNSFFILNSMSRVGDYDNLEKFTEQLGGYFQFLTRSSADEVPLSREVNHARIYAEIQAMRFSNRIRVAFEELPCEYSQILVPRLIMQPIIENAFKHSLEKKLENGLLHIGFSNSELNFLITIEDNGNDLNELDINRLNRSLFNEDEVLETTGIINIHRRLQIKFGTDSGLSFLRGELGGLKAVIAIKTQEENNV